MSPPKPIRTDQSFVLRLSGLPPQNPTNTIPTAAPISSAWVSSVPTGRTHPHYLAPRQPFPILSALSALSPATFSRASASLAFASRASATAAAWSRISRLSARASSSAVGA